MKKSEQSFMMCMLILIAMAVSSCSSNSGLAIEKRKYRDGYHVTWSGNNHPKKQKSQEIARQQPVEQTITKMTPIEPQVEAAEVTVVANAERVVSTEQVYETNATFPVIASNNQTSELGLGNSLPSKSELKSLKKELKNALKEERKNPTAVSDQPDWLIAVLCILLPPLAVGLRLGIDTEFWISCILTLLFWIPGVIYAFIILF